MRIQRRQSGRLSAGLPPRSGAGLSTRLGAGLPTPPRPRAGNTLAEVLISMLAFGVGAVAVATLFPTSVMRSINATRLTKSTILRQNAEAMVDLDLDAFVHDPDRDFNPTLNGANDAGRSEHFGTSYIVDPWGWHLIQQDNNIAAANQFGLLPRFNAVNNGAALTAAEEQFVRELVTLPDSWVPVVEGEVGVTIVDANTATIDPAGDLSQVNVGTPPSRITFFDSTAKFSITRIIATTDPNNGQVTWNSALPAQWFGANAIYTPTSVRIETQEWQFTWLLTVRNRGQGQGTVEHSDDDLNATIDVVCFFRRDFSLESERVFPATAVGPDIRRDYSLDLSSAPGGRQGVVLKTGSWLMDANNARWYRIQRVQNENTNTPTVRLERAPPAGENLQNAVVMPGVVEVFPLGNK